MSDDKQTLTVKAERLTKHDLQLICFLRFELMYGEAMTSSEPWCVYTDENGGQMAANRHHNKVYYGNTLDELYEQIVQYYDTCTKLAAECGKQ